MEFKAVDKEINIDNYKLKSLSLKNFERIRDIQPQNILYLLHFLYGPTRFTAKSEHNNFTYLIETGSDVCFGAIYDYKGKISCGMYYKKGIDEDTYSNAIDKTARVLTDLIDRVIIRPVRVGEFKFFAKSGRFTYEGKDYFEEFGLDKL